MSAFFAALVLLVATTVHAEPLISETGSLSERLPGFYKALRKAGPAVFLFMSESVLEEIGDRSAYLAHLAHVYASISSVRVVGYESVALDTTGRAQRPLGTAKVRLEIRLKDKPCLVITHTTMWVWTNKLGDPESNWYFVGIDEENLFEAGCKSR